MKALTTCLWFDAQAEEAATFYTSVFEDSRLGGVTRYAKEGQEIHGKDAGSVMTVAFELRGHRFIALNGGPHFKFNEAVSFQVHCDTQREIDYYWEKLSDGGSEGPCGWLKDKFGVSWQVVPAVLPRMLADADPRKAERATRAFLQMQKFDIATLQRAFEGAAG
jgi:predicted 3-demethylubiquinone-9 3-methyltransferase (glyoxalase superfamily)